MMPDFQPVWRHAAAETAGCGRTGPRQALALPSGDCSGWCGGLPGNGWKGDGDSGWVLSGLACFIQIPARAAICGHPLFAGLRGCAAVQAARVGVGRS